jgi:hypothetical protein
VLVTGWALQVHVMDGRRVDRLRFTPAAHEPGDEAGTGATRAPRPGEPG